MIAKSINAEISLSAHSTNSSIGADFQPDMTVKLFTSPPSYIWLQQLYGFKCRFDLEKKYGKPIEIEEYRRRWRNPYVGARKVWRTKQTQINVNYSGVLNASTNLLEHVTLTVIYSPLMDDFSSKL